MFYREHLKTILISKYEVINICIDDKLVFELGNYLGSGCSGSVYQARDLSSDQEKHVAIKVLNHLGFKLFPSSQLTKFAVVHKGNMLTSEQQLGRHPLDVENGWWLYNASTNSFAAALEDNHRKQLKEINLTQSVSIWYLMSLLPYFF